MNNVRDGSSVRLRIADTEQEAIASDGSFAVEPGQLALAPGSSGWTNPQGEETRWMELYAAARVFERPSVGATIQLATTKLSKR